MATTAVDFVLQNKAATTLSGAAVLAAPYVEALDAQSSLIISGRVKGGAGSGPFGTNNGNFYVGGFSTEGFAKNGAFHVTTVGTTPVTVNLTNLATAATSHAGDTVFAVWNKISMMNCGAADMTVATGGTNGNVIGTVTVPAGGSYVILTNLAGKTIDSTHKTLTITPTAGGDIVIAVGGA